MSGNLGYQVEHHLFPDMPSSRYKEIAPRVKEVCERYGLPYNSGPFLQQWLMVQRTILRLAFPGGGAPEAPAVTARPRSRPATRPDGPGRRRRDPGLPVAELTPPRAPPQNDRKPRRGRALSLISTPQGNRTPATRRERLAC